MKGHSNIEPLELCVYKYLDNMELKLKNKEKRQIILPDICETVSLRKSKYHNYSAFIPDESPYVVDAIKFLVNSIENSSRNTMRWDQTANHLVFNKNIKKSAADAMANGRVGSISAVEKVILIQSENHVLHMFRDILKMFFPKLIHFLNEDLLPVISTPLYDSTMRPNPKFRAIVKHVILRSSRTIIDTAAFVMIHLFHVWEYSQNMIETKKQIIQNYGNLIISFECTPILIDKSDISPASCLLGIVLETTNVTFWNSLTNHKVFEAFDVISRAESNLKRKILKNRLFPELPEIMKYDTPHLKMPISYFFPNLYPPEYDSDYSNTLSLSELNENIFD